MLTLNNVTKVFGNTKAVDDVCLSVDKPMMIGIIGASGAGKSTLLRMVNVLETVTEGQISFQGTVISHLHYIDYLDGHVDGLGLGSDKNPSGQRQ